jgi:glycosyltransferase involved in cell wall biosynthesis
MTETAARLYAERTPLVSVITATYNRSNVLRYAIESVLWQTVTDWELIVVGDACTDDTADVVAAFADSRIRFVNLEKNVGEQSGPNNAGGRLARGRCIAYLNHDDLWVPQHLELALGVLEQDQCDLVFSLMCRVRRGMASQLVCNAPAGQYEPYLLFPASSWMFRRELLREVGPWNYCKDCRLPPSQDWLRRAWKAGKRMRQVPRLTVIVIASGGRPQSYSRREEQEHRQYFEALREDPRFLEKELTSMLVFASAGHFETSATFAVWPFVTRAAKNSARAFLHLLGISAWNLAHLARYPRRGSYINHLRRIRGLASLDKASGRNP